MIRKWKRIILGTGIVASFGAGVSALLITPFTKKENYDIDYWENGLRINSLNYITRGGAPLSKVYGFYMTGLLGNYISEWAKPITNASIKKRSWKKVYKHNGVSKNTNASGKVDAPIDAIKYYISQKTNIKKSDFDPITGDPNFSFQDPLDVHIVGLKSSLGMADVFEYFVDENNPAFRARIHENAYWSNGDKITANDFVQTIKYILDVKSGSLLVQNLYQTLQLRGAKEILDFQLKDKMSFEAAWKKAERQNILPVTVDGSDGNWVHYHLKVGAMNFSSMTSYMGGNVFYPSNKKFIDSIGGVLKYAQTPDTILSNGPYVPVDMDMDYQITFKRNPYFFLKESVFLDHPAYKISPSPSVQIQLFRDGKLSNINLANEYLQSFYSDPKLSPLVKNAAHNPSTESIIFSKKYIDENKNSPIASKNFRKAISYALNRNEYAILKNSAGAAPANTIYTPRSGDSIRDENGRAYWKTLKDNSYVENSPTNEKVNIGFAQYDMATSNATYKSESHNEKYIDQMYLPELANQFMAKYLEESGKDKVELEITIAATSETAFLAIKSLLEKSFKGKLEVTSRLVAPQLYQEIIYSGDFVSRFFSIATNQSDPWGVYSKLMVEDGYDDRFPGKKQPYPDEEGKPNMEITKSKVLVPGFNLSSYVKTLTQEEKNRLQLTPKFIEAYNEAAVSDPTKNGKEPNYKYSISSSIINISKGHVQYKGKRVPSKLTPFVPSDSSKNNEWLFYNVKDIFEWYLNAEKLLRDSSYIIPLLSNYSTYFASRRGGRMNGNVQSFPYNYQFVYSKDNYKMIEKIESEVRKKLDVVISLERI